MSTPDINICDKVILTKRTLRSKMILRLKKQKEAIRDRKSKTIKSKLFKIRVFKKAKIIMFYVALGGEVNTEEMIREARKLGKIVTVPVYEQESMDLRPCILGDTAHLQRGPYGVREPATKKCVRKKDLDLVIVPGLAFDSKGRRLGRGKGCYDRFLSRIPHTPSVGLAYSFQILPAVPTTTHDVNVKRVIFS